MAKWQAWIVSSVVVATVNVENSEQHRETEKLPENFFNYIYVHVCSWCLMLLMHSTICIFFLVTSTSHDVKFRCVGCVCRSTAAQSHTQQFVADFVMLSKRFLTNDIVFPQSVSRVMCAEITNRINKGFCAATSNATEWNNEFNMQYLPQCNNK